MTGAMIERLCCWGTSQKPIDVSAFVFFSRNFGHQAAVTAGLRQAAGDIVAIIDADLQDPVELIPDMIAKWREGFSVVYGARLNRKESDNQSTRLQHFLSIARPHLGNTDAERQWRFLSSRSERRKRAQPTTGKEPFRAGAPRVVWRTTDWHSL